MRRGDLAHHEIPTPAGVAVAAVPAVPAHADPVAHAPAGDAGAERVDDPGDLVSGHPGYWRPGQSPSFVRESLWQTPEACTRMRTCPAPGSGISRSTIWYGPLALTTWAARILGIESSSSRTIRIRTRTRRTLPRSRRPV